MPRSSLPTRDPPTVNLPRDVSSQPTVTPTPSVPVTDTGPEFKPGDVLAQRYRITRFIARGGMGEVYEAEDLTLHGHLALKTIRPEIAKNPIAVERFKREINIARRITHPNVSRIYDLGIHHGTADTMFLTMEFLAGETLRERIVRGGKMSETAALPLAEQIAAGLAAAHEVGIIHRDFKSANVMLVPSPTGNGERAVVTDFGLARPAVREEGMQTISEADAVVGTPAYMAPEQVEGQELTPAADLYAYGIVLYEMVTAHRPFEGETPLSTAVKRLTEAPPPPNIHVPSLDPVWNSVLLRCLERKPGDRYASALHVTRALRERDTPTSGLVLPTSLIAPSPEPPVEALAGPPTRLKPILAAAFGALALAVVGFIGWRAVQSHEAPAPGATTTQPPGPTPTLRRAVAVLGLRNNSGRAESAWLSTAIAEMLGTELSTDGKLRVSSGNEMARVRSELGLTEDDGLAPDMLARVRASLGVDSVIVGSYTLVGDPASRLLRIDVRLLDATTGDVIASSSMSGTEAQLFDLVSRIGGGLRQKLGLGDLSSAQTLEAEAALPSSPAALQFYAQGLARLRLLDAVGARELFLKAVKADDKHALAWSALSSAYSSLGYGSQASETAAKAVTLSTSLGREQKLLIEARFHEASSDWGKAVEVRRSLYESFPDNLDYGLSLADAQISAGRTEEALATIDLLRALPPTISNDARVDLVEARAHQEKGDFAKQKTLADTAGNKARASGARILLARARLLEATAHYYLGDMASATAAADEARALFDAAGDRGNVARALELNASVIDGQGELEGARRLLEQALAMHVGTGDQTSVARVQFNIGFILMKQGRAAEGEKFFDRSLETFQRVGAKYNAAIALNNIGMLKFNRGDLPAAQKRYHEAMTLFGEIGYKNGTAMTLTNIAEVLSAQGNLDEARSMHEDALAIYRGIGDKGGAGYDLFRIGEVFAMRGDQYAARKKYEEAVTLQTEIGDSIGAADSRVALASLDITEGRATVAEKSAREAEEILRTEGAIDRSYLALAVVADSLLAQGKQRDAVEVADRAWKAASTCEDYRIRFAVAVSAARARAASGNAREIDAALQLLESTRADAARRLFVASALEARLAQGEIERAAGRAAAKPHLSALAKDAESKGFAIIAKRAKAGAA